MKYKIGDKVKIKSWKEMKEEFGLWYEDIDLGAYIWKASSDVKLPQDRIVTITKTDNFHIYYLNGYNVEESICNKMIKEKVGNMKRYVGKVEEEVTNEITPFCGFIDDEDNKGYLVYIGDGNLVPVCFEKAMGNLPNTCYGAHTSFNSVEEFVKKGIVKCYTQVKEYYFGNSLRDLHMWLLDED